MQFDMSHVSWQEFPLFRDIPEEAVRTFFSVGFNFRYDIQSPIVCNGDQGDTFFLLLNGLAKLVLMNQEQEVVGVTLFRSGDFFGEMSILGPESSRSGNVVAISHVNVLAVQKKEFLKMLGHWPMLAMNLAREMGQRLRDMNERVTTEQLSDNRHKVAHTLLMLMRKGKVFNETGPVLMPPLSLPEWAFFCYTSQQAFMESMEQLKQAGAVEWQSQRIVIRNVDVLKEAAQAHQTRLEFSRKLRVV